VLPVLWGSAGRGLSVIIGHVYWRYYFWWTDPAPKERQQISPGTNGELGESTTLTTSPCQNRDYGGVGSRAAAGDSFEDRPESQNPTDFRPKPPKRWEYSHFGVQVTLLLSWAVGGVFHGARIPKYETGLAGGENCGHYELLNNATDAQKIDDDHLVQEPKEARAAYYAKQCYKEDSLITNPDLCAMSYNQSIAYTIEYPNDRPCPFSAPEICAEPYAAIRFTTGLFPTSALGINSPHVPYARRNATCSPLSVNEPFVTRSASETDGRPQNLYWYGRTEDADWTFNTSGDPFDSVFPVYAVT
jgi:hypothetical protein